MIIPAEYSGTAEPLFRKSGNRLSGIGNRFPPQTKID
mgnify:CR=1 FL=1